MTQPPSNEGSVQRDEAPKRRRLPRFVLRLVKRALFAVLLIGVTLLAIRAYDSQRGPPLERWHLFAPDELSVRKLDRTDWAGYLAAEEAIMQSVLHKVTDRLPPHARVFSNRYARESPMHAAHFATDWNRSYVLEPAGPPVGAAVFLHGLTDAPYSLRHVAQQYADAGFVAVGIRFPGHGTTPAALAKADWKEWVAAARLAVREARRRSDDDAPLHLVGYSMGGAVAVKYALEAIDDDRLKRPDRIVLISPMVGVTRFAAFAGLAGLPAIFPPFAKAAWLGILPEFNPFKYNSFPVNAARQSHSLSVALQEDIRRLARADGTVDLPPILTFQSVLDATVSTPEVLHSLYAFLPDNGSELVLFDINRAGRFEPLFRASVTQQLDAILPAAPQRFRMTVIETADAGDLRMHERSIEAGGTEASLRELDIAYPRGIFSLSHVAIPFPIDDPLYGFEPDLSEDFGIRIGAFSARGERGALLMTLDELMRVSSNPFFSYLTERVAEGIADPVP